MVPKIANYRPKVTGHSGFNLFRRHRASRDWYSKLEYKKSGQNMKKDEPLGEKKVKIKYRRIKHHDP